MIGYHSPGVTGMGLAVAISGPWRGRCLHADGFRASLAGGVTAVPHQKPGGRPAPSENGVSLGTVRTMCEQQRVMLRTAAAFQNPFSRRPA